MCVCGGVWSLVSGLSLTLSCLCVELCVGLWHTPLFSDRAVRRDGRGTVLLRIAALVGVFEL